MKRTILTTVVLASAALALAGCGSPPKPRTDIALSDSALQSAELAGAREHAPIELRKAREKRNKVDGAMRKEEFGWAKRYSEQALVDAELAKAKAESVKAELALKEARSGIQLMKDEIKRVNIPQ